jgi:hypothetical protein
MTGFAGLGPVVNSLVAVDEHMVASEESEEEIKRTRDLEMMREATKMTVLAQQKVNKVQRGVLFSKYGVGIDVDDDAAPPQSFWGSKSGKTFNGLSPEEVARLKEEERAKKSERRVDYSQFLAARGGEDSETTESDSDGAALERERSARAFMSMDPQDVRPSVSEEPQGLFDEEDYGDEEDGDEDFARHVSKSGRDLLAYALSRSERRDASDYY